jgi:very-short-patch-repair endonuclease
LIGAPEAQSKTVKKDYKSDFEVQMKLSGIQVETEFIFASPRKWRSDYRVKNTKVLIEFEGGLFAKGKQGHSSVSGILRDMEKYNSAALLGYTVIRIAPNHVTSGQALKWVEEAIGATK